MICFVEVLVPNELKVVQPRVREETTAIAEASLVPAPPGAKRGRPRKAAKAP